MRAAEAVREKPRSVRQARRSERRREKQIAAGSRRVGARRHLDVRARRTDGRGLRNQADLNTMLGNLCVMSFERSAMRTATLRAICL